MGGGGTTLEKLFFHSVLPIWIGRMGVTPRGPTTERVAGGRIGKGRTAEAAAESGERLRGRRVESDRKNNGRKMNEFIFRA